MILLDYTNLSDIERTAQQMLFLAKNYKIWAFYGEMGSGKTTIIAELVRQLNSIIEATSPTFSIVNEYPTKKGTSVFHFDFYRIKDINELMEIGIEEYIEQAEYIFIEWPQIFEPILNYYNYLKIELILDEAGNRRMNLYV